VINEILHSYSLSLDFLRRLVADVPDASFTAQANGAVNHPAWIIGHIVYSMQAIGGEIGLAPWLPSDWEQMFGTGSTPLASRDSYPSKDSLLNMLASAEQRIKNRLISLGEKAMAEPLPDVRHRDTFPTVGHAVLHILTSHTCVDIGHLIVWRRALCFGTLVQSFT
jgi:hypothetical protein